MQVKVITGKWKFRFSCPFGQVEEDLQEKNAHFEAACIILKSKYNE